MTHSPDWIRRRVVERAAHLGLNPREIARRTGRKVSDDMVRLYMDGAKSMTSGRLQHVLDVLGLDVQVRQAP